MGFPTEKWRLDRLLQRKAREGVEIFVIVYNEVSDDFTPVSSAHAKASLRALHPNIHFQRSPSHVATGTLLWSHVCTALCFSRKAIASY